MLSKKVIRAEVKKAVPETQITGKAVEFIEEACGQHLHRLITEAINQQRITSDRLKACGIPPEKRLNLTHLRNAERIISGEENV